MIPQSWVVWLKRMQSFADRAWYFPFVGFLGGIDLFILVVPTDGLLISSVMLRPKLWLRAAIWVSLGCALGALVLGGLVQWDQAWVVERMPHVFGNESWAWIDSFIDNHGFLALSVLAFSPAPQFPGVMLAALAGMSALHIFLAVFIGRGIKYLLFAYGASHAPKILMRLPMLKNEVAPFNPSVNKKFPSR